MVRAQPWFLRSKPVLTYLQLKYRKLRPYHYLDQRPPNARQELDRYSERVSHPALYAGHGHSQSGRQNHKESMFYHYLNDKHRSVPCDN